jgi:hypothetical protein
MSSTVEVSDLERNQRERELNKIAGKAKHIEINERTMQTYKEEYAKKGLTPTKESDYPQEDFHLVKKTKSIRRISRSKTGN